jgi:hypothetical protein
MEVADADHRADVAAPLLAQGQQLEVLLQRGGVLAAEQRVQSADVVRVPGGTWCRVVYWTVGRFSALLRGVRFVSHEINKHAVLQIHTEARKP